MAVKEIKIPSEQVNDTLDFCKNLCELLTTLASNIKHPNLVEYLNVSYDNGVIRLFTEQVSLSFEDIPFPDENSTKMVFLQVVEAMQYLH